MQMILNRKISSSVKYFQMILNYYLFHLLKLNTLKMDKKIKIKIKPIKLIQKHNIKEKQFFKGHI